MLKRISIGLAFLIAATALFAGEPERHVVVVRDGQVLVDDGFPTGPRGYVGISMLQLTPELRDYFGAPKDTGVLVSSLAENGPAAKAGVRVGDVIVSVNGKTVGSTWELTKAMRDVHKGDAVRLEVIRGKARQTLVATAEERDLPQMMRAVDLNRLERELGPLNGEWRMRVTSAEDIDALRARIRELEARMKELQRRLDQT